MKKIRNMGNYAVCAAVTLLTACAANPIDEPDKTTEIAIKQKVVTKKVVDAKVATAQAAKAVITAKQAQDKKKQIIAMAKPTSHSPKAKSTWKKPVAVAKAAPTVPKRVIKKSPPKAIARKAVPKPIVRQQRQVKRNPNLQYAVSRQPNNHYRKAVRKPASPQRRIQRIDPDRSFGYALSHAAIDRTKHRVRYDGAYIKIAYPWGDVPKSMGVCTDVVIRAYRKLGIDLQQEVHKDISSDFYAYPNLAKWGLTQPDPNIDHRRVYNLQAFFKRHKAELPRSRNPKDYKPGDLVTWMVGPSFPHIGIVVNKPSKADPNRLMISHNIGHGPKIEDILFRFPMTGHYRYTPKNQKVNPALHFAKTPPPASIQRQNKMDYTDLLEASRYLIGDSNKKAAPRKDKKVLQVKKAESSRINLAQLDPAALNALLKY